MSDDNELLATGTFVIEIGELGQKWSTLPGNVDLPDWIKALIDGADFQASNIRGMADIIAGRTIPLDEFLARWNASK